MSKDTARKEAASTREVEVTPLKEFSIHQNEVHIELVKGVTAAVPEKYIENLKTEGVI